MLHAFDPTVHRDILRKFLEEDIGRGDITTLAVVPADRNAIGNFVAKAPLVLAGIEVAIQVFALLDADLGVEISHRDGAHLREGQEAARVWGQARALLMGERVALNLLQRLSGIATLTRRFVDAVHGTQAKILDTRKTTPGLRAFEKYAVAVGGGLNHRLGLDDAVLIKDNHIKIAGGVRPAIDAAQSARGRARWLEVELTTVEELQEALRGKIDVVLLDNMKPEMVRQAVELVRADGSSERILVEASGGITLANVRRFAEAGVDWISVGALTHSAPAVDISFEIEPA